MEWLLNCELLASGWDWHSRNGLHCFNSHLRDENLDSNIPNTIGYLSGLTSLALGRNSLKGTLPSYIGVLTALTSLAVGRNLLTGQLPNSLNQLTNLEFL